jgi:hypothetical protein
MTDKLQYGRGFVVCRASGKNVSARIAVVGFDQVLEKPAWR